MWIVKVGKGILLIAIAFFLGKTAIAHGQDIQSLQFQSGAWLYLSVAVSLILWSEIVAGALWYSTLDYLRQTVPLKWSIKTFFNTTLAKYLPGNVWHLVGRVDASRKFGVALERVGLSVILETLFMVAGGILLSLLYLKSWALQFGLLAFMLVLLHPWGVSQVFRFLAWIKHLKPSDPDAAHHAVDDMIRYPVREISLGMLFILLRAIAFSVALLSLSPIPLKDLPQLIGGFGMAWSLGIVLPAPGGIGVFESAAIQVMDGVGTPAVLLSAVVLFRFLCILTESIGVGLIWMGPKVWPSVRAWSQSIYHSLTANSMPALSVDSNSES